MKNNNDKLCASNKVTDITNNQAHIDTWLNGDLSDHVVKSSEDSDNTKRKEDSINETLSISEQSQQQLIHSLLITKKDSDSEMNARINNVMQAINSPPKQNTPEYVNNAPWFQRWGSWAASLLLMVTLTFTLILPSNDARATMNEVIESLSEMGDRLYKMKIEVSKQGKNQTNKSTQKHLVSNTHKEHKVVRFQKAKLYLRADNQFVFIEEKRNGKKNIKGSNGHESWQVSGKGKIKNSEQGKIKVPLASKSADLAFMNLSESLQVLKASYDLTIEHKKTFKSSDLHWSKITAIKADKNVKGAKKVVLFFDPDSHVIQKLIFDKVHMKGRSTLMKVTLTLQSTEILPEYWFEQETHL